MLKGIKKLLTGFGGTTNHATVAGTSRSLFFNCKNQAEHPIWYTVGKVETDFRSVQSMIQLHVWMIHRRLVAEAKGEILSAVEMETGNNQGSGSSGRVANSADKSMALAVQECFFDEMWEDTSNRIRGKGINELSVNKNLKDVQGYSLKFCMELDHALTHTDEEQVVDELGGALWRHAFLRSDYIYPPHVLTLARYVREEQRSIMDPRIISTEALFDGRIQFGDPPTRWGANTAPPEVKKGKHHTRSPSAEGMTPGTGAGAGAAGAGEWREAVAQDGKVYYWHTGTRKVQWEKPVEMLAA